jgi:hypothetical protein
MTKLTQATAVAMSTAASMVRADWDHPGILHALRIEADRGTHAEDVFVALANLCANREARTPGLLNKPGAWWQKPAGRIERRGDHNVPCADHPDHDMPCQHDAHRGDMTPEQISAAAAGIRAQLARRQEASTP